jgi:hypothetical protein
MKENIMEVLIMIHKLIFVFTLILIFICGCNSNNTQSPLGEQQQSQSVSQNQNSPENNSNTESNKSNLSTTTGPGQNESKPVEQSANEVNLDLAAKKKLNVFLSNFTEVWLKPYSEGNISDQELINFAVMHDYINNLNKFTGGQDGYLYLSKNRVSSTIKRFFGISFTRHRAGDIEYTNGNYRLMPADGEQRPWAQVTRMIDNGNSNFTVYFEKFTEQDFPGFNEQVELVDIYSPKENWRQDWRDIKGQPMKATVKKILEGNTYRYELVDYSELK